MGLEYVRRKKNLHGHSVEHRIVMEKTLGRKLKPEEIVHHLDGNKRNNSPENLSLCKSRKEHNNLHAHSHCPKGHEFIPENTGIKFNSNGKPYRRCKACHNNESRLQRQRKK